VPSGPARSRRVTRTGGFAGGVGVRVAIGNVPRASGWPVCCSVVLPGVGSVPGRVAAPVAGPEQRRRTDWHVRAGPSGAGSWEYFGLTAALWVTAAW
jgi:hypothetical protein